MKDGVAIIGMACRFPGVRTLDQFWDLLRAGRSTIVRTPASGSNREQDLQSVDAFGVLDDIDRFDNRLFGITAREAAVMDPQQRIWLELVWHALEDAGLGQCANLTTGVFAACNRSTYLENNIMSDEALRHRLRTQVSSETRQIRNGNEREFLPLRTSFALGLNGPSINVQTACSSAVVAVATACNSLVSGETDICIAGGISIVRTTEDTIYAEPNAIHSPTGLCRPFDAAADGTVFGDGGGVVVLRRMADAVEEGNRVYSVIRGWGITNDGGSKSSFVAPNPDAQASSITKAWEMAQTDVGAVSYIEAHGTGTQVGDPIEFEGLSNALGDGERRCWIGSVKSSIGHIDTASGIAGLIKTSLMLDRRYIVATAGFQNPNPLIGLENSRFRVADKSMPWKDDDSPLFAGVTALGVGGTNCHLALAGVQQEQVDRIPKQGSNRSNLLVLSAQNPTTLQRQIQSYMNDLPETQSTISDYCQMAAVGRRHLKHRVAVVGHDATELVSRLRQRGENLAKKAPAEPRVLFAYSGQLSSYAGMAQELYDRDATFNRWINTCADILDPLLGTSLQSLFFLPGKKLERTQYEQPALCALQISLAEMWKQTGIQPSAVLGYSVGEIAAAYCAKAAPLEDLLKFAVRRAEAMESVECSGFIASVHAPVSDVIAYCNQMGLEISGFLHPEFCIIAGKGSAKKYIEGLSNLGYTCRVLSKRYGFHSSWLDEVLPILKTAAGAVRWQRPKIPYLSTSTGQLETSLSVDYWVNQARNPIRFGQAVELVTNTGCDLCLELGPDQTLTTLAALGNVEQPWLSSLNRKLTAWDAHLRCLADLYETGAEINWRSRFPGRTQKWVDLPKYHFDSNSFWIGPKLKSTAEMASGEFQFETIWSTRSVPYLSDHRLFGQVVVPASHQIAWVLVTVADHFGHTKFSIEDWVFLQPVTLDDDMEVHAVLSLEADTQNQTASTFRLAIYVEGTYHDGICLTARLVMGEVAFQENLIHSVDHLNDMFPISTDAAQFYAKKWINEVDTGARFRRIQHVWSKADRAVAEIVTNDHGGGEALDATIVEAGLQCLHAGTEIETHTERLESRRLWVPHTIDRVTFRRLTPPTLKWCQAVHHPEHRTGKSTVGSISYYNAEGKNAIEITGFHLRPIEEKALKKSSCDDAIYQMALEAEPKPSCGLSNLERRLLIICDEANNALCEQLAIQTGNLENVIFVDAVDLKDRATKLFRAKQHKFPLQIVFVEKNQPEDRALRGCMTLLGVASVLGKLAPDIQSFVVSTVWENGAPIPEVAAVQGLARVVMNEYPNWNMKLVSHDAAVPPDDRAREIIAEFATDTPGTHIVYRNGGRFRYALHSTNLPETPVKLRADRSYVVVAQPDRQSHLLKNWLVDNGAGHVEILTISTELALLGINSSEPSSQGLDFKRFFNFSTLRYPIAGLFFIPWGTEDELLELKPIKKFDAETNQCSRLLSSLSAAIDSLDVDHFVCFSSSAAVVGSAGQASYAALTSFMDALCIKRREKGLRGLSINWGPWKGVGSWIRSDRARDAVSQQGWRLLDPEVALNIMGRAMASDAPTVSVLSVNWNMLAKSGFVNGLSLPKISHSEDNKDTESQSAIDELALLIGEDISSYPKSTRLIELGLDSLMAVRLRNFTKRVYGVDIPVPRLLVSTELGDLNNLDKVTE